MNSDNKLIGLGRKFKLQPKLNKDNKITGFKESVSYMEEG